jgi:hypothetical protein
VPGFSARVDEGIRRIPHPLPALTKDTPPARSPSPRKSRREPASG